MKKIKKIFLGISAWWSTMITKVYATIITDIQILYGPPQDLYGPMPLISPLEKVKTMKLPILAIIAIIVGLNVILRKKFKEKKNVLIIVLIISIVVVTVFIIIFLLLTFIYYIIDMKNL